MPRLPIALMAATLLPGCGSGDRWEPREAAPIEVALVGQASGEDEAAVLLALDEWNTAAGSELFVYGGRVTRSASGRVNVFMGEFVEDWGGHTDRLRDRVEVRVDTRVLAWSPSVVAHELGHSIDLWHDNDPMSVMAERTVGMAPRGAIAPDDAEYASKVARGEPVQPEF